MFYRFFGPDPIWFETSAVLRFGSRANDWDSTIYAYVESKAPSGMGGTRSRDMAGAPCRRFRPVRRPCVAVETRRCGLPTGEIELRVKLSNEDNEQWRLWAFSLLLEKSS